MTIAIIQSILNYMLYTVTLSAAFLFTFAFIAYTCRRLKDKQSLNTVLTVETEVVVEESENENAPPATDIPATPAPSLIQPIDLPQDWRSIRQLAQRLSIPRWNRMKRPELEAQLRLVLSRT